LQGDVAEEAKGEADSSPARLLRQAKGMGSEWRVSGGRARQRKAEGEKRKTAGSENSPPWVNVEN